MHTHDFDRREFLIRMTALGSASIVGNALRPDAASAATVSYDPAGRFEITVSDVEFRRSTAGRMNALRRTTVIPSLS